MRTSIVLITLIAFQSLNTNSQAADTGKDAVAGLVRALGYGGAIHNFKNYVLRGDEKYRAAAEKMFAQSETLLNQLSKTKGLTKEETAAAKTISEIVNAYQTHLPSIGKLHKQGKTVESIDEAVTVDDSPAIEAVTLLRVKHTWTKIEDLDFHIGYGTGIHNFKNFVLRADEKYRARATLGLSKVLLIVARFRSTDSLSDDQTKALDQIERVVRAYEVAIPKVQELVGEGKTAAEIDAAVKVDDAPGLAALSTLRKAK
jgi:methyl-accepting chemotaxis protein